MRANALAAVFLSLTVAGAHAALTISSIKPTKNVSCAAGVCSATAKNAVLSAFDVIAHLAQGNLTVASGSAAMDIRVEAAMTLDGTNTLTFDSFRSVFFDDAVSILHAPLVIDTDDGGPGGRLAFGPKGSVQLDPAGSLTIDGESYVLVTGLRTLAAAVQADPSANIALVGNSDERNDLFRRTPIPDIFNGKFEGLGNSITHYKIDLLDGHPTAGGMFAQIGPEGVVENFIAKGNAFAQKSHSAVTFGGLVGVNQGLIRGVSIGGHIQSSQFSLTRVDAAGGIAGENDGIILRSSSTASLLGGTATGGVAGRLIAPAQIVDSWASGRVQTKQHGGGLVGFMSGSGALISNSFATGQVNNFTAPTGGDTFIGGLVGTSEGGSIQNSYATGQVLGRTFDETAPVEGGLIGHNEGTASASYATGSVTVTGGTCSCGGLIGTDAAAAGSLTHTYWDLETSSIADPSRGAGSPANDPGITGLTSAQFLSGLPAGFGTQFWAQSAGINDGYPYLKNNLPQ